MSQILLASVVSASKENSSMEEASEGPTSKYTEKDKKKCFIDSINVQFFYVQNATGFQKLMIFRTGQDRGRTKLVWALSWNVLLTVFHNCFHWLGLPIFLHKLFILSSSRDKNINPLTMLASIWPANNGHRSSGCLKEMTLTKKKRIFIVTRYYGNLSSKRHSA